MRSPEKSFNFLLPTRREIINQYIEKLDADDHTQAESIAQAITNPALPLADHIVLIPVAAHQEKDQVGPALAQYAKQETTQPFSVVLGLNYPAAEAGNPDVLTTIERVEQAKRDHPHVDIRAAVSSYETATIGKIRRDLWNGALLTAINQGSYVRDDAEVIGINHDIDAVCINPRYIQRIQDFYNRRQRAYTNAGMQSVPHTSRSTMIKHAPSADHPTISKGVYWIDYVHRQLNVAYEAGMIFPFSDYADKGGFSKTATTHETHNLFNTKIIQHTIPGTTMQTSPRRYIDRLKHGYDNIWTPDTFGAYDNCRSLDESTQDMTQAELEAVITKNDSLRTLSAHIASRAIDAVLRQAEESLEVATPDDEINDYLLLQQVNEKMNKTFALSAAVLERVVQAPDLAGQTRALAVDYDYKEEIINHFYLTDDN